MPSIVKNETDDNARRINIYCPTGFHGDPYLLQVVDTLAERVNQFVETGTEAGSTVGYFARMYPHLQCVTIETDYGTFETARNNLANHTNIEQRHQKSVDYLRKTEFLDSPALFWLDAHSHGWGCDLGEETAIILERWLGGYILFDDFLVPERPDFGYDWYESYGKLSWEKIVEDIPEELLPQVKQLIYPNYEPKFGWRGWALVVFGDAPLFDNIMLCEDLREEIRDGDTTSRIN